MEFQASRFLAAAFEHRTEAVPMTGDLAAWFTVGEGETAAWTVRSLTGEELARANEAEVKNRNLSLLVEAIAATDKTKAQRISDAKKALGVSDDVPGEMAKRLEMLSTASIDPVCTLEMAVKLATTFPIEFYQLTNKIIGLTGMGQVVVGKSKPSGLTGKSEAS